MLMPPSSPDLRRRASSPTQQRPSRLAAAADKNAITAPFSPASSHSPLDTRLSKPGVLIQRKTPMLTSTPPDVTRTLAYSYAFILPLNELAGLLSWTTDDPWQSFLLVAGFWAVGQYGDSLLLRLGPLCAVVALMLAMYARRFSSLSSTEVAKKKHKHSDSQSNPHRSLDEVVENLRLFTSRCNILLDPLLQLTDFLSTQTSATTATTRPALIAILIRSALITLLWFALGLSPFKIITFRRIVMAIGTTILTWHSKPARVTRTLFGRSRLVRKISSFLVGLDFSIPSDPHISSNSGTATSAQSSYSSPHNVASAMAVEKYRETRRVMPFTFTIMENQRRWLLLGWTNTMIAGERDAWTDEHQNKCEPPESFQLPSVEGGQTKWQWVPDSAWHVVDGAGKTIDELNLEGWVFCTNKWQDGRRGKDAWGRYTRYRKWCRDAQLVDVTPEEAGKLKQERQQENDTVNKSSSIATTSISKLTAAASTKSGGSSFRGKDKSSSTDDSASVQTSSTTSNDQKQSSLNVPLTKRKGWHNRHSSQPSSAQSTTNSLSSFKSTLADKEDDGYLPFQPSPGGDKTWGMSDDAEFNFG